MMMERIRMPFDGMARNIRRVKRGRKAVWIVQNGSKR
jgi:hypothetical protein